MSWLCGRPGRVGLQGSGLIVSASGLVRTSRSSGPRDAGPIPVVLASVLRRWDDRRVPEIQPLGRRGRATNYPRRQQYRRVSHAGRLALTSGAVAVLALYLVSMRAALPGVLLLAIAVTLGLRARHWLSLAGRSGVGAGSEDEVRRALEPLREHGWRVHHALRWAGRGDIDSVAIAPNGVAFAIVFCPCFGRRECPSLRGLLRRTARSLPGVRPPGLLHLRGGVQSAAGGVAGRSGVLDGG